VEAVAAAGGLAAFHRLDGRLLIALDGSEHFCSRKIGCAQCSRRRRSDGGVEHFHAFLGASLVAPGHTQVLPRPPEFIAPQDGAEKQDCERAAAKRWLATHGPTFARFRPVYLGDDLYACQPLAGAIRDAGGNFILTCKPTSHQTIAEYLAGVDLEEHRQSVVRRGQRTTSVYRWLSAVPLRAGESLPRARHGDALLVNWFSLEIRNARGKRTYYNSFVTDLPVSAATVADPRLREGRLSPPAAGPAGRSRMRPSTSSRPTATTSNTTSATASSPSPACSSPSTSSPSPSTPSPSSPSSPGAPPPPPAAPAMTSSSTCAPSPPTSSSQTGKTSSTPS